MQELKHLISDFILEIQIIVIFIYISIKQNSGDTIVEVAGFVSDKDRMLEIRDAGKRKLEYQKKMRNKQGV